jgi:hypothetical protein
VKTDCSVGERFAIRVLRSADCALRSTDGEPVRGLSPEIRPATDLQLLDSERMTLTNQIRSVVKEVALDCLSTQNIAVVSIKSSVAGSDYRAVRGILGETFLRHFDILFDNQHRRMTLDAVADLADSSGFGDTRAKETVSDLPMVSCQGASVKTYESEGHLEPLSGRLARYGNPTYAD